MNTERIINDVNASMTMENLPLTEEDKERIRLCLQKPELLGSILQGLLRKYTV